MEVNIEPNWKAALQDEFDKPYFSILTSYVLGYQSGSATLRPN